MLRPRLLRPMPYVGSQIRHRIRETTIQHVRTCDVRVRVRSCAPAGGRVRMRSPRTHPSCGYQCVLRAHVRTCGARVCNAHRQGIASSNPFLVGTLICCKCVRGFLHATLKGPEDMYVRVRVCVRVCGLCVWVGS
jgi:hypothetical protein